jgi:SAM-dependent methyltransferase
MKLWLQETPKTDYFSFTWPSSLALSLWLLSNRDRLTRGSRILELGCGTGLLGLVCTALHSQVTCTDYDEEALNNVKLSAQFNQLSSIETRVLNWNDASTWSQLFINDESPFDYILASDIFYDPQDFECILSMISFFLHHSTNKDSRFITAYQERSSKRSITYLLKKWKLKATQISFDIVDCEWKLTGTDIPSGLDSVFLFEISRQDSA